jgi:hypothetical protein
MDISSLFYGEIQIEKMAKVLSYINPIQFFFCLLLALQQFNNKNGFIIGLTELFISNLE